MSEHAKSSAWRYDFHARHQIIKPIIDASLTYSRFFNLTSSYPLLFRRRFIKTAAWQNRRRSCNSKTRQISSKLTALLFERVGESSQGVQQTAARHNGPTPAAGQSPHSRFVVWGICWKNRKAKAGWVEVILMTAWVWLKEERGADVSRELGTGSIHTAVAPWFISEPNSQCSSYIPVHRCVILIVICYKLTFSNDHVHVTIRIIICYGSWLPKYDFHT